MTESNKGVEASGIFLTDWEIEFLESIRSRSSLTERQEAVLRRLYRKTKAG